MDYCERTVILGQRTLNPPRPSPPLSPPGVWGFSSSWLRVLTDTITTSTQVGLPDYRFDLSGVPWDKSTTEGDTLSTTDGPLARRLRWSYPFLSFKTGSPCRPFLIGPRRTETPWKCPVFVTGTGRPRSRASTRLESFDINRCKVESCTFLNWCPFRQTNLTQQNHPLLERPLPPFIVSTCHL